MHAKRGWTPQRRAHDQEGGLGGKLPEGDENEDPWTPVQPLQAVPALRRAAAQSRGSGEVSRYGSGHRVGDGTGECTAGDRGRPRETSKSRGEEG